LALTLIPVAAAQAKTYEVTTLKDPGPAGTVSLALAIDYANEDATATAQNPAVITFASKLTGSINLTSALPGIEVPTDIRGPGAHKLTINAAALSSRSDPVFYNYSDSPTGALTISGLSIDNTRADSSNDAAGAVSSDGSGSLTLQDDIFSHDGSRIGGSAARASGDGVVTISGCTFSHDTARYSYTDAGAVWVTDSTKLTISDSTFTDDSAAYNAGALSAFDTPAKISDSTFVGNSASRDAGAVLLSESASTIVGSTITGNSASYTGKSTSNAGGYGGGVEVQEGALSLEDSIVAGNHASGNKHFSVSPIVGSVFADIYLSDVGSGGTLTTSFSLIQQDTGKLPAHSLNSTDITGRRADLNPLANNGGPTETELPRKGSPVINAGKAFGLKYDQRGDKRTVDYPKVKKRRGSDGTDIGAVELQKPKKKKR
jgi:hypothetical protein